MSTVAARAADPYRVVGASFIAGAGPGSSLPPPTQAEIAFAGRSNVGKSSLLNALVERRSLVRTSSTPGSTRQVNLFEARAADGAVFSLVDLPGYGFAKRSRSETATWAALIEGYIGARPTLAAVVLIVDVRRGLEDDDRELIAFCRDHLAHFKCPRTIDFVEELPRLPTGKLYKRLLRDRYWEGHTTAIV